MLRKCFRVGRSFEQMIEKLRKPFGTLHYSIVDLIISGGSEMYYKLQEKWSLEGFFMEEHEYLPHPLVNMLIYSYPHHVNFYNDPMLYAMKRIAPSL